MIRLKTKIEITVMKKLFLFFAFACIAFLSNAQAPLKIGYADPDYILSQLPEAKQIDAELKSLQSQLKTQIEGKVQEFQKKLADYQANLNTMLAPVRENTERELQQLQQNLEKLQTDAQTTVQNKQNQLMQPVYLKIGKGIEAVAKENGFTLILSNQVGGLDVVLYGEETLDVSDLVLKKLGITPKPAEAANTQTTPPPANQPATPANKPADNTAKPKK
jgi:outer membrane protein